jgi:hypothetical protein
MQLYTPHQLYNNNEIFGEYAPFFTHCRSLLDDKLKKEFADDVAEQYEDMREEYLESQVSLIIFRSLLSIISCLAFAMKHSLFMPSYVPSFCRSLPYNEERKYVTLEKSR